MTWPRRTPFEIGHLALHPGHVRALGAIMLQDEFAGRVEAHAACETFENPRTEFILEPRDPPVERRGRQAGILRRLADRTRAGHRLDQPEGFHMPHVCLQWCTE